MTQSILDALLAQYVTPYSGAPAGYGGAMQGQQGNPTAMPTPAPGPQAPQGAQPAPMGGAPAPMPQAGPPTAPGPTQASAEQQIADAMMAGADTQAAQAVEAMEAGAAPFERKWQNTQEQRFKGGLLGLGEQVYDMVQEKKLSGQRDAVDENKARLERDRKVELADQKYKDAKTLLELKHEGAPPEAIDALSRRYAQGEEIDIEPEVILELTDAEKAKISRETQADMLGIQKDQLSMADTIYDDAKADLQGWDKAEMNMNQVNKMAEKGWKGQGAGQVATLYSFVKSIDPDSVVREGEVRLAQMGESMINRFLSKWEGVDENTIMSEEMYEDVVKLTQEINGITRQSYAGRFDDHISRAEANGIPPERVFGKSRMARIGGGGSAPGDIQRSAKEKPTGPPTPGTREANKQAKPTQIQNAQDYNDLPSGTVYLDPNGVKRTKP